MNKKNEMRVTKWKYEMILIKWMEQLVKQTNKKKWKQIQTKWKS